MKKPPGGGREGGVNDVHIVAWDDHTGQRHERSFDNQEDAIQEALALEAQDNVEYVYSIKKCQ